MGDVQVAPGGRPLLARRGVDDLGPAVAVEVGDGPDPDVRQVGRERTGFAVAHVQVPGVAGGRVDVQVGDLVPAVAVEVGDRVGADADVLIPPAGQRPV